MKLRFAALVAAVSAILVVACNAEWADCPNCEVNQVSISDAGNSNIVIVVNVDNDVNVDVDQSVAVQVQEEDNTCKVCTPVVLDAGTPPSPVVDAGIPDCICKKVCKQYKRIHVGHAKSSCNKQDKLLCVSTVVECTPRNK